MQRLSQQKDLFRTIEQPKSEPFFAQNGFLFESTDELGPQLGMLAKAQRLVQVLASDPSLRATQRRLSATRKVAPECSVLLVLDRID